MSTVTSIIYSNNRGVAVRFVLDGHREAMYRLEDKMAKANCEPLLVVSKDNSNEWWLDDITFVGDLLDIDDLMTGMHVAEEPVVRFLEDAMNMKEGEVRSFKSEKSDLIILAAASTDPCDEEHAQCTNDCNPIEL